MPTGMTMRRSTWRGLGVAILLLALGTPLLATSADGDVWVRILPAAGTYQLGEQIPVEVWIEDVTNLYGAEIHLAFDASCLSVIDADPSQPGVQIVPRDDLLAPELVVRKVADNQAGTVWYAVTQLEPTEPVTGTGVLFSFSFQAIASGSPGVTVTQQLLSDRDANPIPADTAGASYQIEAPYRTFVPLVLNHD
jgi:hypothetical protein